MKLQAAMPNCAKFSIIEEEKRGIVIWKVVSDLYVKELSFWDIEHY